MQGWGSVATRSLVVRCVSRHFTGVAPARLALATALCLSAGAVRADDVDITTSTNNGLVLDGFAGTTARVFSGVTVSNTTFNFNCPTPPPPGAMSLTAICATTKAWTLTNEGTIGSADFGDAVHFTAGGSVVNFGSIDAGADGFNGIWIVGGSSGSVDNKLDATIHGTFGAIVIGTSSNPTEGMVTNAGMITSDGQAIGIAGDGTVINLATGSIVGHGDANAVSMILGTSHVVTNSGLIQSNDFGFGTGVALDNGTVTNNVDGRILGAYNAIWANGSGATSVTNYGYLEASQAEFGGSAIQFDAGGSLTNYGTITAFTSSSTADDAGVSFTGAGSITNGGTIESTDGGLAISFNGSATHTLNLDTGSVLGGNVQGGGGTDNLVLMGSGTEDIGKFLDFETLTMQGSTWSLTGTGAFGSTTAEDGLLAVNGTLTSPTLVVNPGATLGGDGTIVGAVTVDGTVAPGNSVGTLSTGDIVFDAGSTYEVEVAATGAPPLSDLLAVTGTATINGGTVNVLTLDPHTAYSDGQSWVIIDTTGGVSGTGFDGVSDNSAFLEFSLSYDDPLNPFQVLLTLDQVADFQSVARTFNQRQAASGLQALDQTPGSDSLAVFNALSMLSPAEARAAFDMASGEIHASLQHTLLDISDLFVTTLGRRAGLAVAASGPGAPAVPLAYASYGETTFAAAADRLAAWVAPMGEAGHIDGDGNAAKLDHHTLGVAAGVDWAGRWLGGSAMVGLAAGYTHAESEVAARLSDADFDSAHAGLYAAWDNGRLELSGAAAYAFHAIDTKRGIVFPGVDRWAAAALDGNTVALRGEAAYRLPVERVTIAPLASAEYLRGWKNEATETGAGALDLTVAGEEIERFTTGLGLSLAHEWAVGPSLVSAEMRVLWEHAFGDDTPSQDVTLAGSPGAPFTVLGPERAEDWLGVGAGVGVAMSDVATLTARYNGAFSAAGGVHQGHLSLGYRF